MIGKFAFGAAALLGICAAISQEAKWNLEEISWTAMVSIITGALVFQIYSMIRSFLMLPTFEYLVTLNPLILCASLILLQSSADKVILNLGTEFKVQVQNRITEFINLAPSVCPDGVDAGDGLDLVSPRINSCELGKLVRSLCLFAIHKSVGRISGRPFVCACI